MWGIAGNLDEAIIVGIAAYYAAPAACAGPGDDPALDRERQGAVRQGLAGAGDSGMRRLPRRRCAKGMADFPRLAGQHAKYVVKQLNYIQSLVRAAPVMHGIVKDLTPARDSGALRPTCSRSSK